MVFVARAGLKEGAIGQFWGMSIKKGFIQITGNDLG